MLIYTHLHTYTGWNIKGLHLSDGMNPHPSRIDTFHRRQWDNTRRLIDEKKAQINFLMQPSGALECTYAHTVLVVLTPRYMCVFRYACGADHDFYRRV